MSTPAQYRQRAHATAGVAALFTLALTFAATSSVAGAQDEGEHAQSEGRVECDADVFDEDDGIVEYDVEPGQVLTCTAFGLDSGETATWRVEFFDDDGEPIEAAGEADINPEDDGSLTFGFVVPADMHFGWFEGFVRQGAEDTPSYFVQFFGFIVGEFFEDTMRCSPDPVRQGETVQCVAEEMPPGEFDWQVYFFTVREFLLSFFFHDDLDEGDADGDVQGVGVAGEDGLGRFSFRVPAEGAIEIFVAVAEQDDYYAVYAGAVDPALAVRPTPEPADAEPLAQPPKPVAQVPKTAAPAPKPAPVVVERPKRVETGGGGTAPARSHRSGLVAGLFLVFAGAALAVRPRRSENC